MNKIIVPTGYMGSGSSAITDLISEYKNCSNEYGTFEYVFLHCPDGVFDLADKLLLGNNAIRSDEALRTFRKQMKKLYDKKFWWVGNYKKIISKEFMKVTDEYINSITEFKYPGYWYMHEEVNFPMFIKLSFRKILKILTFNKIKFKKVLKYNDGMQISLVNEKEFYQKTKGYIYKIIGLLSNEDDNIILDQFLLPFNLYRIDNYFDEKLKVIVVERDPRDLFILNKYIWNKRECNVPIPTDANEFCKYYKKMRENEKPSDSNKILRIKFEDLIYNYEKTVSKIEKFLNFKSEDHVNKKSRFIPEVSIKNTQIFNDKKYAKEINIIEKQLSKYLYKFPYNLTNDIEDSVD